MENPLDTLMIAARLKLMPRTGWRLRGVPQPESVADHSFGVAFVTLVLADLMSEDGPPALDLQRALRIALIHDLAESLVTDLPATMSRFLPPETKHAVERAALIEILEPLPHREAYLALWEEYNTAATPEARLVRDADKLEMMIQAYLYEQTGQRNLHDFWQADPLARFSTPIARAIYDQLLARRQALFLPPSGEDDHGSSDVR